MGEARMRRRQREALAAALNADSVPAQLTEITAQQAARLYTARTHICIPVDEDNAVQVGIVEALAAIFGPAMQVVRLMPGVDRSLPRPRLTAFTYVVGGEHSYPLLLMAFIADTTENRCKIDRLMDAAHLLFGARMDIRVSTFPERGPVLLFDDTRQGVAIVLNMFDALSRGQADDLSLN
jgi:hypothetical protein